MQAMFYSAIGFIGTGIGEWETGKVNTMEAMFAGVNSFIGTGVDEWNTENVTNMGYGQGQQHIIYVSTCHRRL